LERFLSLSTGVRKRVFFSVLTVFLLFAPQTARGENFPVPDIIKENVAFWIRIYTEVSLGDGLLHDREYPQIVYERVSTGNRTGRALSNFMDGRRKPFIDAIIAVRDSAPDKWGATERRVAELFKLAPQGALDSAEHRIRFQRGQRERFRQGLERSGMYIDTISAILKAHGVPDELKYLPHVESSFNPEAYSHAGAAGLWQFMRATGRAYMKIDYMFDERRDPIISSHAAARFLRANYDMLGRWPLAVTAYNHGPNGIRRAVASVGSQDIADILQRHESPTFKFASKNFYSCFIAVLQIMENPGKYFQNINYKPRFTATSIQMPFAMRPDALVRAVGITEQQFRQLNPSFRPVVFTQQRPIPAGYAINLPDTISAERALAAIGRTPPPRQQVAAAAPASPASVPSRTIEATDGYYTVVRGDNLNSIARRLGIPMAELAAVNNITNSSRIYVGQVLMIPAPASSSEIAQVQAVDTSASIETIVASADTLSRPPDTLALRDTIAARAPDSAALELAATAQRLVASARTLTSLRSPPAALVVPPATGPVMPAEPEQNVAQTPASPPPAADTPKIDSARAVQAEPDTLSTAAAFREAEIIPPAPRPAPGAPAGKPEADTRFNADVYDLGMTVAPGGLSVQVRVAVDETIGHFAEWMQVGVDEIRRINNLGANAALPLGRVISIPINASSNINRFEVNRLQYHMAIEEDFFARYTVVDFEPRTVKSGDNLWRICNEARVPMWLLKKFNRGVNFYNLRLGDNLWIPKISPKDITQDASKDFDPAVTESMETETMEKIE
jgi:membrane-bound lytic murein transglycosylase D